MKLFDRFFRQKPQIIKEAPTVSETAWQNSNFFTSRGGKFEAYNDDDLALRKGYDIYNKMLRDPQVKAAFNLVLDLIVARNYRFELVDDSDQQKEIAEFLHWNVENAICSTFQQAMRYVLMSKAHGFSVNEKIFVVDQYQGKDKWIIHNIKPKPYNTFSFEIDNYGNIKTLIQEQTGARKRLDPNKFIIHRANSEIDPVYGQSDLRSAYRAYWEKDNIQKFWNIYLERIAGGFVVAHAEQGAPSLSMGERNNFESMLKNITQSTSFRVPSGYKLDVINGVNTDAFERAVKHRDGQIAKALLVPSQLGYTEDGNAGSQAKAKTQFESFMQIIKQQGELLADSLNEQLFKELVWWNFGTKDAPLFTFEEFTNEQKREIATSWREAVKDGVVTNTFADELRTRELLHYDAREETEEDDQEEDSPEPEQPEPKEMKDKHFQEEEVIIDSPVDVDPEKPHLARVNFASIMQTVEENEAQFFDSMAKIIDKMYKEVLEVTQIVFTRAGSKDDMDMEQEIGKMDDSISAATKSEMNQTTRRFLRDSYDDGRAIAQGEMEQALKDAPDEGFAEKTVFRLKMSKRRVAVKADIKKPAKDYTWSVLNFVDGLDLDPAEKYFAAKAFWMTGDISQDMIETAKLVILNGIRDEKTIDEITFDLEEALGPIHGKVDPKTGERSEIDRPQLATIVRTNITDAFNQAQVAVFTDPELAGFVEALEYSAFMDNRTTPFCREYDGRKFKVNDPIWSQITPPAHFNCRSRTIAVTILDKPFEISQVGIEQPAAGFGSTLGLQ